MKKVLIVESPGYQDIDSGDRRGEVIRQQLGLLRVLAEVRGASKLAGLMTHLVVEKTAEYDALHLAMHGDRQGLYFTDGGRLDWAQMQIVALSMSKRLVVLDACESVSFTPDTTFADFWNKLVPSLPAEPPRFVLTMWGSPYYADSVLAWGLFYAYIARQAQPIQQLEPRALVDALKRVHAAGLPKICAWHLMGGRFKAISPWEPGT